MTRLASPGARFRAIAPGLIEAEVRLAGDLFGCELRLVRDPGATNGVAVLTEEHEVLAEVQPAQGSQHPEPGWTQLPPKFQLPCASGWKR